VNLLIINLLIKNLMGIDFDAVCLYGIEFIYNDLQEFKLNSDVKEIAEVIGTDCLSNVWSELGSSGNIKFTIF
jgi:hypothetical protein